MMASLDNGEQKDALEANHQKNKSVYEIVTESHYFLLVPSSHSFVLFR